MDIFDLIGPIMVGPSSSHTAGAVRIGLACRRILGEEVSEADITLSGSFAATGRGHGTDRAIVAGLLGMTPDDERVPDSFSHAREKGLLFSFAFGGFNRLNASWRLGEYFQSHPSLIVHGWSSFSTSFVACKTTDRSTSGSFFSFPRYSARYPYVEGISNPIRCPTNQDTVCASNSSCSWLKFVRANFFPHGFSYEQ